MWTVPTPKTSLTLEIDFLVRQEAAWPDYRPLHQAVHGTADYRGSAG